MSPLNSGDENHWKKFRRVWYYIRYTWVLGFRIYVFSFILLKELQLICVLYYFTIFLHVAIWDPCNMHASFQTHHTRDYHAKVTGMHSCCHELSSGILSDDMEIFRITSHFMMTSSNGNIFRVTGHLCGEFTGPRWIPRTKASDAELWCFLDLRLDKRLSKQSWGWWLRRYRAYYDVIVMCVGNLTVNEGFPSQRGNIEYRRFIKREQTFE